MEQQLRTGAADILETDIVFNCPQCGKSLAIDERGAGYLVKCPDCQTEIEVPGGDEIAEQELADAESGGDEATPDLAAQLRALEAHRIHDAKRMKLISGEIALIQASLDRIAALIEDSQVENRS